MKTGILGGTFDPIHVGHLIIAEVVRSDFPLDRILFMPTANPPHKKDLKLTDKNIRLRMVELAICKSPYFVVLDEEIKRGGISYTIETIKQLKSLELWSEDELYLILGADSLIDLKTWKDPEDIIKSINILVVARPGYDIRKADERFRRHTIIIHSPLIDISSSEIRQRIKEDKSIHYLVPDKVEAFIQKEGLYR
jgi:nicotinate-nucleotide adenylyltransferase